MTSSHSRGGVALLWIFTASGFAGLIYESIWTHYLGLILGHSAYAQVLVLALFMGGMALGAWFISRKSALLKQPLIIYALVELILGIFGVGFHGYYKLVSAWCYGSFFPMLSPGISLEIARWIVAGLLIFPQCILLGMTFPLMSAGYIRRQPQSSGKVLAGLYFSNSLGAVFGALAATFILLPAVGLPGTVLTAGIVSCLVAMAIWPIAKYEQPAPIIGGVLSRQESSSPVIILLVAGITGASSFVYEVTWVRMLSMVLGSTIHAFEIMLSAFIAGIAFGGLWLRKRADNLPFPKIAAGWAQVAMGCMALTTLFLYNQSFSWLESIMHVLNRSSSSAYSVYNFASAFISFVIMFPTAFFAGMTLPLLTLALLKDGVGESAIGKVYAANTLGSITGVVIAVFIGMPLLGLRISLWLAAAADIAIGILLLFSLRAVPVADSGKYKLPTYLATGFALVFLACSLIFSSFDSLLMSSGVFRVGSAAVDPEKTGILYHKDGRTATVILKEVKNERLRTILTNGKPDAAISTDKSVHVLDEMTMMVTGVIPMIHHPRAKTVAVIGFGSGMTTHFVLGNPNISTVDTIEIEPAMVEAANHFRPFVERAFTDPRSHILIDDAKSYFATNHKKYDIIISEPSNPWVNGVASLFSEEFYRFIPEHLNNDGVFAQWLQTYEITPELINSIFKALLPNFSDVRLFSAGANDWLLVATPNGRFGNLSELKIPDNWSPIIYEELANRGIASDGDLSLLYLGDKDIINTYTALYPKVPANSDFFPILQLGAAQARFSSILGGELTASRESRWPIFEALTKAPPVSLDHNIKEVLKEQIYSAGASRKAQLIYAALINGDISNLRANTSINERLAIEAAQSFAGNCIPIDKRKDALAVFTHLAGLTIPYLMREDADKLWGHPGWVGCRTFDPITKRYLSFISASSLREHDKLLELGEILLGEREVTEDKVLLDYIVGAMQLSAYSLGKNKLALELEFKYGKGLPRDIGRILVLKSAQAKFIANNN